MRFLNSQKPQHQQKASAGGVNGAKAKTRKRQATKPIKRMSAARMDFYRRLILGGKVGAFVVVFGVVGVWGYHGEWIDKGKHAFGRYSMLLSAKTGLKVKEVLVVGRENLAEDDLRQALDIQSNQPIFSFDLYGVKQKIEALGWVESVQIERRISGEILIHLKERVPAAIWHDGDHYHLVDMQGHIIGQQKLSKFRHLKIINGANARQHIKLLMQILNTVPSLQSHVISAAWVGDRRWNFKLENNIAVRLPEKDPTRAWQKLAAWEQRHHLLQREVEIIDLRFENQPRIKMTQTGLMLIKKDAKNL